MDTLCNAEISQKIVHVTGKRKKRKKCENNHYDPKSYVYYVSYIISAITINENVDILFELRQLRKNVSCTDNNPTNRCIYACRFCRSVYIYVYIYVR